MDPDLQSRHEIAPDAEFNSTGVTVADSIQSLPHPNVLPQQAIQPSDYSQDTDRPELSGLNLSTHPEISSFNLNSDALLGIEPFASDFWWSATNFSFDSAPWATEDDPLPELWQDSTYKPSTTGAGINVPHAGDFTTPMTHRSEAAQCQLTPQSEQTRDTPSVPKLKLPCEQLAFRKPQPTDESIILAEDFCHVKGINQSEYNLILDFYCQQESGPGQLNFPKLVTMNAFVQLYFEYFDSQFPFIHPSMLCHGDRSWILMLALATVGCQYSEIVSPHFYFSPLQELLKRALKANVRPLDLLGYNLLMCGVSSHSRQVL